jgi:hypothetical protein
MTTATIPTLELNYGVTAPERFTVSAQ